MKFAEFLIKNKTNNYIGIACFLFFGFFLVFKNAYSISLGLLILIISLNFKNLFNSEKSNEAKKISFYFIVLGIVWSHSFDGWISWTDEGDFFLRYGFGAFILIMLGSMGIDKKFIFYGMACGAIFSGIYAIFQYPVMGRAEGYTNAIRFGNIALLMSVFLMVFTISIRQFNWKTVFFFVSIVMGFLASFLSLSRGGWLLLLIIPFLFIFLFDGIKRKLNAFSVLLIITFISISVLSQFSFLQNRVNLAQQEVQGYFESKENFVESSVGARLEQWSIAWKMGIEKPFFGWGDKGFFVEREKMVERGEAHPSALNLPHTHHDFLEMWATRGFLGILFLLYVYIYPIYVFYPTKNKLIKFEEGNRNAALAFYFSGCILPVSYFVFGLTDMFFNLTIGHVFMIFSMIFIIFSINGLKK